MPRDISGVYTLPAATNPVADGTIITTAWANGTLSDIAAQLNNVLTRDGLLGPNQPVQFPDGTQAAPSITFNAQANLGVYRKAASTLAIADTNQEVVRFSAAGTYFTSTVQMLSSLGITGALTASGTMQAQKQAYCTAKSVAYAASLTIDASQGNVWTVGTLTGNVSSLSITSPGDGQSLQIRFVEDATGGRTVAVPSGAKVDGTMVTGANRVSMLIMTYFSAAGRWEGNWLQVPA